MVHDSFDPCHQMVQPSIFYLNRWVVWPTLLKSMSVLNSVTVVLAHSSSEILYSEILRTVISAEVICHMIQLKKETINAHIYSGAR